MTPPFCVHTEAHNDCNCRGFFTATKDVFSFSTCKGHLLLGIRRYKDEVIGRVEERLELWTHHNVSHQEDMQILRYADRQKYGA